MKRMKLVGLAVLAVLALGVVSVSLASATEPNVLPNTSFPILFTDTSGAGSFDSSGVEVNCSSDESSGDFTNERLGTFDILFLGCLFHSIIDNELELCTGLPDTVRNSILVLGTFHIRYILERITQHHVGIEFLLNEVHFECVNARLTLLVFVRGCVIGLLTPANTLVKSATVTLNRSGTRQEYTEAFTEASEEGRKEACKLEANGGGLGFREAGEETTETITNFEQGGRAITLEVMA